MAENSLSAPAPKLSPGLRASLPVLVLLVAGFLAPLVTVALAPAPQIEAEAVAGRFDIVLG